jgi:CHASE2 domain-containing sensor protein
VRLVAKVYETQAPIDPYRGETTAAILTGCGIIVLGLLAGSVGFFLRHHRWLATVPSGLLICAVGVRKIFYALVNRRRG